MAGARTVFISHTSEFGEFPTGGTFVAAVQRACNRAGYLSVDMSDFTADDLAPAELCRQRVAGCDIYLGIIGYHFGSPVRDEPHHSYTELEFAEAGERGLVRRCFLLGYDASDAHPGGRFYADPDHGGRQAAFRARIQADGLTTATFGSVAELERLVEQALRELGKVPEPPRAIPMMAPPPPDGYVDRPDLVAQALDFLLADTPADDDGRSVGFTTALQGAGGFGKSVLASRLCSLPQVLERFPDGILWATLGEEPSPEQVVVQVTRLIGAIAGESPTFADPMSAGRHLAEVIGDRRMLLVVDDAWHEPDLRPFIVGAPNCVRLITTRNADVLPAAAQPIPVDRMEPGEAADLLRAGLDPDAAGWDDLDQRCGRWPVLLGIVNGYLKAEVVDGGDLAELIAQLGDELVRDGPASLDVGVQRARERAIGTTVDASLRFLERRYGAESRERFERLAIFPEDVSIPLTLLARWWDVTSLAARRIAQTWDGLSLLAAYDAGAGSIRLHDVVRAYLKARLGTERRIAAHRSMLDAWRPGSGWADLDAGQRYLWSWLSYHLVQGDLLSELRRTIPSARFLAAASSVAGASLTEAQIAHAAAAAPELQTLERAYRQSAHLLGRLPDRASVEATLLTRLSVHMNPDAVSGPQVRLTPVDEWALPDLAEPPLERVFTGHAGAIWALVFDATGQDLSSAADDGTIRIWDVARGTERRSMAARIGLHATAFNASGSRFASNLPGEANVVCVLDMSSGTEQFINLAQNTALAAIAFNANANCLAIGTGDGTVWLKQGASRTLRRVCPTPRSRIRALAFHPVQRLLAVASAEAVRVWDPISSSAPIVMSADGGYSPALAFDPSGRFLATAHSDGTRVWDMTRDFSSHTLSDDGGPAHGLAFASTGQWLGSIDGGGAVRVYAGRSWDQRWSLGEHPGATAIVAHPNDNFLATAGQDCSLRLWNLRARTDNDEGSRRRKWVRRLAFDPSGRRIAAVGESQIRVWDVASGCETWQRGGTSNYFTLAFASGGELLVGASVGGIHVIDAASAAERQLFDTQGSILTIACDRPGERIVYSTDKGAVALWNSKLGVVDWSHQNRGTLVSALTFDPRSTCVASAGADGYIRLLDPDSGTELWRLHGDDGWLRALAFDSTGRFLATAGEDGSIRIWDLLLARLHSRLLGHSGVVMALTFDPRGSDLVSVGSDGTLRVWDVAVGASKAAVAMDDGLWSVDWHPHRSLIAAGGGHGVYVFRLDGSDG